MFYYSRNVVVLSVIVMMGCKIATVAATDIEPDLVVGPDDPQEIQKAVCTVTAGEVRASAEAVTTKTLQGVCGSAEMQLALRNLELKLYKELQEIKQLLKGIPIQRSQSDDIIANPAYSKESFPIKTTTTTTVAPEPRTTLRVLDVSTQSLKKTAPQLKSFSTKSNALKEKSFSYYWKLENFTEHVNSNSEKVDSPIFSIKGKPLRITGSFNHLRRDFLFLRLVYASFEKRDKFKSNIILDTGGIFKHIDDKLPFKHKISILDQNNGSNDLVSQEFDTLDSGFPIPMSALLSLTYSKNNSLLIQISLYL